MARDNPGHDPPSDAVHGCPIGIFHTVADAAAAHAIDEAAFSAELLAAIRSDPSTEAPSAFETNAQNREPRKGEQSCA
jgi:hypothetical protein